MTAILITLTWVLATTLGAGPGAAEADAAPAAGRRVVARFNGAGIDVRWFPDPPGFRGMRRAYRVERIDAAGAVVPIHHEPITPVVNVGSLRSTLGGLADTYVALIEKVSPDGRVTRDGFNEALGRPIAGGIMMGWAVTYPEVADAMGMRRLDRDVQPRASYRYRVLEVAPDGHDEETLLGEDAAVAAPQTVGPPRSASSEQIAPELVRVTWGRDLAQETADDITRYSVLRQEAGRDAPVVVVSAGAPSPLRAGPGVTLGSYIDRSVSEGRSYKYWVVAVDLVGTRSKPVAAGTVTLKDMRTPPPPVDASIGRALQEVTLAWSDAGLPEDVTGFEVLEVRRAGPAGGRLVPGRVVSRSARDGTTWTLRAPTRPGHYEWAVRSVDAAGNRGVLGLPVELDIATPVILKAPGGLRAERKPEDGWIKLKWQRGGGADAIGYVVERRQVGSKSPPVRVNHEPIPLRDTEWLERLAPVTGEALEWRVRSQDGAGRYSAASPWVGVPDVRPPEPASLLPPRLLPDGVHLAWTAPNSERIIGFSVEAAVDGGGWSPVPGGAVGADTYTAIDASRRPPETPVRYRVVSRGAPGLEPAVSNVVSAWTGGDRPLEAPAGAKASCGRAGVSVQWSAVTGATSYDVRRAAGDEPLEGLAATAAARWEDRTAVAGERYRYEVRARYRNRSGPPSEVVSVGCDASGKVLE